MKAWFWVKAAIGFVAIGSVFVIGFATGATSISESIDQVQISQLASCLPLGSTEELSKCMGIKIVGDK